jgi:hypothetical protein
MTPALQQPRFGIENCTVPSGDGSNVLCQFCHLTMLFYIGQHVDSTSGTFAKLLKKNCTIPPTPLEEILCCFTINSTWFFWKNLENKYWLPLKRFEHLSTLITCFFASWNSCELFSNLLVWSLIRCHIFTVSSNTVHRSCRVSTIRHF